MKITDYKIAKHRKGFIATATVNGHKNVVIGTPACTERYCQRDIMFIKTWGMDNPKRLIQHIRSQEGSKSKFLKALEDE